MTSMSTNAPFLDDKMNMYLHGREGGQAVFEFTDYENNPRDMSTSDVYFEVQGFRKKLTPGDQTYKLILTIERGELIEFMNKPTDYIIIDESNVIPHIIVEARLSVTGWN